jgi:hypothetical protein
MNSEPTPKPTIVNSFLDFENGIKINGDSLNKRERLVDIPFKQTIAV